MKNLLKLTLTALFIVAAVLIVGGVFNPALQAVEPTLPQPTPPQTPVSALVVAPAATVSQVGTTYVGSASEISVHLISVAAAANTSNTTVTIDRSLDGVTWQTGARSMTLANAGTTTVNVISNFSKFGENYWRFNLGNTATNGGTLVTNTVTIKVQTQ
jgi:hypothetical protein